MSALSSATNTKGLLSSSLKECSALSDNWSDLDQFLMWRFRRHPADILKHFFAHGQSQGEGASDTYLTDDLKFSAMQLGQFFCQR